MDRILRKYTNELIKIITENNIQKSYLSSEYGTKEKGYKTFKIQVKNTPFYFILVNNPDNFDTFTCSYIQFKAKYPLLEIRDKWRHFIDIKPHYLNWIKEVNMYFDELQQIDLWEQLLSSSKILNIHDIDFNNKENFNKDEIKQIKLKIDELKLLIAREFDLQDEYKEIVNARLDYIAEASERMNKFDWKSILINSIFSIAIALSLDTSKGLALFELVKKVFSLTTQYFLK